MKTAGRKAIFVLALLAVLSCSGPTPEEQIRALMEEAQAAAKERDLDALMATVSDAYADADGRNKLGLRSFIAFYFRQHGTIYVLYQERELVLQGADSARLRANVGLAGQPFGSGVDLTRIQADLLAISVTLRREDGEWKVASADWKRASISDFVN